MHCRAKVPAAYPCACAMEDVPRAISGASVTRLWWLPAHRGEGVAARGTRDRLIAVRDAELYSKTLQIEHLKARMRIDAA
jgi:hypothetical protein